MLTRSVIKSKLLENPSWIPEKEYKEEDLTTEDLALFIDVKTKMTENGELISAKRFDDKADFGGLNEDDFDDDDEESDNDFSMDESE